MKTNILGVRQDTLNQHGAVSEECVLEMAAGALERAKADVAISTSGIAGPDGGTDEKPVGLVCFSVVSVDGPRITRSAQLPGGLGGSLGAAGQLGSSITEMEQHVSGLQKNLDTLKKIQSALMGK